MDCGGKYKKKQRPITVMTYDDYEDIREGMNRRKRARRANERANLAKYYGRQRLFGLVILLIGVVCLVLGCNLTAAPMEHFGIAVGLIGVYIMITKQMMLIDSFYFEYHDRMCDY